MNRNPTETGGHTTAVRETEEKYHSATTPPSGTPKFVLYTIPAILLALFAWLVFNKVQARQRVRAETFSASSDAGNIPVSVVHPRRADAVTDLNLPGNVQAFVETPIYARTNGYLKKWFVDIGGKVKAGDLLATIDTPEVDQQLKQAEAAVLQAEANRDLAKTTADRWHNLLKSDGVSQQEVDQNDAALKARQADLNAAAANVERLKDMQSFQNVTAPFSGIVTARNTDIGSLISNGTSQALFRMSQIDTVRVYVSVPESYTQDIRPGIEADLSVAEIPGKVFKGRVARSAGAIDPTSKTLLTEVDVPNPKGDLLPGAYAQVLFHLKAGAPPLTIPSNTLIFRTSATQVAVAENGIAHLRTVVIGRDLGNSLEVISGLAPSDAVILNPPDSLADGAIVSIQQTGETPAPSQPAAAHPQEPQQPQTLQPQQQPNQGAAH
jgi:RND family efflux transporter MFP subunit